jgi:hypothetical protein
MRLVKGENGGTLTEFAIVSPFLFLLLFGIIEFGVLLHDRAIVINASREGARFGSTIGESAGVPNYADCSAIRTRAQDSTPFDLLDTDILVTYDSGPASSQIGLCPTTGPLSDPSLIESGDRIVVTVSKPFNSSLPFIGEMFDMEITSTEHRTIVKGDL